MAQINAWEPINYGFTITSYISLLVLAIFIISYQYNKSDNVFKIIMTLSILTLILSLGTAVVNLKRYTKIKNEDEISDPLLRMYTSTGYLLRTGIVSAIISALFIIILGGGILYTLKK
jgi:hypothetical protein